MDKCVQDGYLYRGKEFFPPLLNKNSFNLEILDNTQNPITHKSTKKI